MVQLSSIWYIHKFVQLPALFSSKTFSSPHKNISYPLNNLSPITFSPHPLISSLVYLLSWLIMPILGISYKENQVIYVFCVWHLPLSIKFLRLIQLVACTSSSFLCMAESYSIVGIYCILFTYFSIDRHWVVFAFCLMNSAATKLCVQVPVWACFYFPWSEIYLEGELLGHMVIICSHFWGTASFPQQLCHYTFLPAIYEGSDFSTLLPILVIFHFLD